MPIKTTAKIWILAKCDPAIWFVRPLIILQFISLPFYIFIKKNFLYGAFGAIIILLLNIILKSEYKNAVYWLPIFILGIWFAVHKDFFYSKISLIKHNKL